MTETVTAVKIEDGARYAVVVNGLPEDVESEFADFMGEQLEKWNLSRQKFLVLTCPSGLELRFERVEAKSADQDTD